MATMNPEDYQRRKDWAGGWEVEVRSYRLGDRWLAEVANASVGAGLIRREAGSREQAEREALAAAGERLARTRTVE